MMMRWLFLIPLTTGILSGYISYYLMDEIAYFTGALSLISLLICLFIAPWQLQLFILVLVLLAVRLLWIKVNAQPESIDVSSILEDIEEEVAKAEHQRTYRGIPYPSEDPENVPHIESPKKGTYRGVPWQTEQNPVKHSKDSKFIQKYRGIPISNPDQAEKD